MLAWALVLAAAALFARRAVLKPGDRLFDFGIIYAASHAWLEGANPYDQRHLVAWWSGSGGVPGLPADLSWQPSVVFPTTLVAMAPLAWLTPPAAARLWLGFLLVMTVLLIGSTVAVSRLRWTDVRTPLLVAWVLALAPLHTGVLAGQPAVAAGALVVAGACCAARRRDVAAGVLLGIAAAFKLQLGLPFVLLQLYLRRWRAGATGLIVVAAVALVAIARLEVAGVDWTTHWAANLRSAQGPGGANDYTRANPTRYHLVNAQLLAHALVGDRRWSEVAAWTVFGALGVAYLSLTRRGRREGHDLLHASIVAALSLLPVYHRTYDAIPLALAMAWAVARWDDVASSGPARVTAIALLDLLLPLAVLHNLLTRGYLPMWLEDQPLWDVLAVPHHVWAVLSVSVALLYALARTREEPTGSEFLP